MIDIAQEPLLSLTEAARAVPPVDGKRPHPSTIFRWIADGVRGGIRLESVRVGRRVCTTRGAIERFLHALANAPAPTPAPSANREAKPRTPQQRQQAIDEAKARLRENGVLIESDDTN